MFDYESLKEAKKILQQVGVNNSCDTQGDEEQSEDVDLTQKGKADISNRERIKIAGEIFGRGLRVQNSLRVLLEDLQRSPVFSEIKLIKSGPLPEGQYNSSGIKFELYVFPAPNNSV